MRAIQTYTYDGDGHEDAASGRRTCREATPPSAVEFPVPPVDFNTVTSDFVRLSGLATGIDNLAYVTPAHSGDAHGWYIKILANKTYQVAQVTAEY